VSAKRVALARLLDEVTCMWLPNRQYTACSILQPSRSGSETTKASWAIVQAGRTPSTTERSDVTCPRCVMILPNLHCLDQPL
jgi:hypothetical protein